MKNSTTFNQILSRAATNNRHLLLSRAKDANRIAKTASGASRKNSYAVKVRALQALAFKFADDVVIVRDPQTPKMVVVGLKDTRFGLHAPESAFG